MFAQAPGTLDKPELEKLISDNQSNRSYTDDKDLFHVNGHTYALTKMWGDDTLGSIEAIIRLNTSGPEIEFEPTNKGSVEVPYKNYVIRKSGSGTITLEQDGQPIDPVISGLRILAEELNVPLTRSPGSTYNTQTLGKKIIQAINAL